VHEKAKWRLAELKGEFKPQASADSNLDAIRAALAQKDNPPRHLLAVNGEYCLWPR
jgi:hypothetical protein